RRHVTGNDLCEPTRDTGLLQRVIREEANPLAVWRPERRVRSFGARQRLLMLRRQRAKPQLSRTSSVVGDVDDLAAVRGYGERHTIAGIQRSALGGIHVETDRWCCQRGIVASIVSAARPDKCDDDGREERRRPECAFDRQPSPP